MGVVTRRDVWCLDLGEPRGSEAASWTTGLVVSADVVKRSGIAVVIIAPSTTSPTVARARGNVTVPAGAAGLDRGSTVNVSALRGLDRRSLSHPAGRLPTSYLRQVGAGLRLVLEL